MGLNFLCSLITKYHRQGDNVEETAEAVIEELLDKSPDEIDDAIIEIGPVLASPQADEILGVGKRQKFPSVRFEDHVTYNSVKQADTPRPSRSLRSHYRVFLGPKYFLIPTYRLYI